MNFLFFDIECAGVTKTEAKICAFGYCLTDERFNIKVQEDILINPLGRFALTDRKGEKGLVLPYDYSAFKKYPNFKKQYPKIAALFAEADMCIGHAIGNDVRFLNLETKRFRLPYLSFSFLDTQFLYMNKMNIFDHAPGLGAIAESLSLEFVHHRAADDAFATMCIAKKLCSDEGVDLIELAKKYGVVAGRTDGGRVRGCTSSASSEYKRGARKAKEDRSSARVQLSHYLDKVPSRVAKSERKTSELYGKIFHFTGSIEGDLPRAKNYIYRIYEKGGRYSMKFVSSNILVKKDGEEDLPCKQAAENGKVVIEESALKELLK